MQPNLPMKHSTGGLTSSLKRQVIIELLGALLFYCFSALTSHFIIYTLLILGWTPIHLQNSLNSLWYRFSKVLETFLGDFDLSAGHPWCEFPVPPHPKGALVNWDLVSVEAFEYLISLSCLRNDVLSCWK